jgi:predicted MPP superfamily phosphohydrolase
MLAGAAGMTGLYGWLIEPHWVEMVERQLPIRHLPRHLRGTVLAQISDVHVGPRVAESYIVRTFEAIRARKPDIVVYTGDFVSYFDTGDLTQLSRVLTHAPHGRLATLGVLGNHDYGRNWSQVKIADQVTAVGEAAGITMLRNSVRSVAGLQVIGLEDLWSPRWNVALALRDRDRQAAAVALCHNPDGVDEPGWGDYAGWVLAGHTHGGQCKPPFLPPPILPVKNLRYSAGEIEVGHGRRLYINRGLGHLYRVRFNVRPEVTLFRLANEEAPASLGSFPEVDERQPPLKVTSPSP